MTLSAKLSRAFTSQSRKRGENYYRYGQVRLYQGSDSSVAARVQGGDNYEVSLEFDGSQTLLAECGCLYFDREGACKHLWATVLAAEQKGYLTQAASAPNLYLDDGGFDANDDADELVVGTSKDAFTAISRKPAGHPGVSGHPAPSSPPAWQKKIAQISGQRDAAAGDRDAWPAKRQILYILDVSKGVAQAGVIVSFESRDQKLDGSWGRRKTLSLKHSQIVHLPLAEDREIFSMLVGGRAYYGWSYGDSYEAFPNPCQIRHPLEARLLPLMARTGRLYLSRSKAADGEVGTPLTWDEQGSWRFALQMRRGEKNLWTISGILRRGTEQMELSVPFLVTEGLVFTSDCVAALSEETSFQSLLQLRQMGGIDAWDKDRDDVLAALLGSPGLPPVELPEELQYEEVKLAAVPCLHVRRGNGGGPRTKPRLRADLSFDYEGRVVPQAEPNRGWYEAASRRFLLRDTEAEKRATDLLSEIGVKFQGPTYWDRTSAWEIAPTKLPRVVRALLEGGWHIDAEGRILRRPGAFRIAVSSGVDWFELRGEVQYGEATAQIPELLQALRRGENMVQLDNGEYGVLPEEWLRRFGHVAGLGTPTNGHLRFRRSQAGLLDALLAAQPEASCDETFARVRKELSLFQGVQAAEQPTGFVGQLRDYQREGLGWMNFLRQFSFGGCLADDMGVGKTAQVLALLESRRELKANGDSRPSLVVVPKSLVFNWKVEAARFTPQLRVLDYTGLARTSNSFAEHDIVLTTYGTLRRDALVLKDVEFDYLILDEAQAVKNENTESAKAVRLLQGRNRLAMSGTPIENHLGELWTLFEFLNPGMLGAASAFKMVGGATRNPDEESRRLLASALRPFILRRTKEQVARELPPKTEQTIHCEMEPAQRKLYNELLQHYRASLLTRIQEEGIAKSKIQVLEALLRLRQAACHPGLIDRTRSADPSAKLDVLLARVQEVLEEGHKALVFSQFTSFLKIVRNRLDAEGIAYEYLDGATRDRQARVDRFQTQPDCRLFLVSLKAGGLGLNLTAAEYVFLLDPWWNPAVEAQAVDRAHRIGQTQHVFAYRLIARDTVEEKVLQLQETKRDLAAAIIGADNRLIRNLRREDLEMLLS
ncbi:MAG TPA: DEAD/DEAH box helicase [Candidatus Angelobacter sp.]